MISFKFTSRKNQYSITNIAKGLFSHISSKRRLQLFLVIFLMFITSVAEVFSIGLLIPFLGVIGNPEQVLGVDYFRLPLLFFGINSRDSFLFFFTAAFCLSAVMVGFLRYLLMWTQTKLSFSIGIDLSVEMYEKVLYQPYIIHVTRNSSEIIAAITSKVTILVNNGIYPALVLLSSLLLMLAIFATLLIVGTITVVYIFVGLGFIYFIFVKLARKKLDENSENINREQVMVLKALQEGLGGIRDVLLDNTQEVYVQIYKKSESSLRNSLGNIQIISSTPRYVIESLGMMIIAIAAYVYSAGGIGASNAIPVLGAIAFGAQKTLPLLQQFYANFTGIMGSKDSLSDALKLLNLPYPERSNYSATSLDFDAATAIGQIELKNASFRYANKEPLVLRDINLFVPSGSIIGIIGATGSGKSTLIDLILGLLRPVSGEVLINGKAFDDSCNNLSTNKIAHVPQFIFLSDQSVTENIAFGVPRELIDIDRVKFAAESAKISTEIEALPDGYNTLIGERGARLSGGQRQRVGIARAIYKQANIIILDEATSSLDSDMERAVMTSIEAVRNVTIVMVAHRISTLRKCDAVYEMSGGVLNKVEDFDGLLSHNFSA